MLRYEIIANVGISVDLHNNYTVVALAKWNKEKESYLATFYIKQTDPFVPNIAPRNGPE